MSSLSVVIRFHIAVGPSGKFFKVRSRLTRADWWEFEAILSNPTVPLR